MWAVSGDLDPESGHVVDTTIHAIADPGEIDGTDGRTPPQRRADALVEACRFWLDHNTAAVTSSGVKPHITVTLDYETLVATRLAPEGEGPGINASVLPEIDGLPVVAEDIRRLACDADVVRIVTRGDSEVLDIGRATRVVPSGMRRALDHRDGGCTWVGCGAPAGWCDAHHIEHWADGGPTSLGNLRLLCRRHHRAMHDYGTAPPVTRGRPPPDP